MKKNIAFLSLVFSLFFIQNQQAQSIFEKWPELDDFHKVMQETYHPSEEGDLDPIKGRIDEMVLKAHTLKNNSVPDEFNTPEIVAAEENLYKGSLELQKLIEQDSDDEAITASLESLHDVFHDIVGLCKDKE
ncbi:hypothetical protein [Namhaeicola litoreus]|uniref:Uncharacterized protein n=1 Tax=Namhaeicola litoreus TaxID=1052145 RepID=A0ABW3Y207_9FLAO